MVPPEVLAKLVTDFSRTVLTSLDVQGDVEGATAALAARLSTTIDEFVNGAPLAPIPPGF